MSNPTAIQTTGAGLSAEAAQSTRRQSNQWSYVPAMDAWELHDRYVFSFDAPGLNGDQIEVSFEGDVLQLHGTVTPRTPESVSFLRQEYGVGDFHRSVPLGRLAEFVDVGQAGAEYRDGVLTVTLAKSERVQPKRIEVKVG